MASSKRPAFLPAAAIAWLVVGAYGLRSAFVVDDGDWGGWYAVLNVALIVGAVIVVMAAGSVARAGGRPRMRAAGLVVSGVGVAACLVAWALPLWMTLLGAGLAMLAVASTPHERRAVALLAAGQLAGLAVMFAGIAAEFGRRDEWGDYPAASGAAVVVTAVLTLLALVHLTSSGQEQPDDAGSADLSTLGASST